MLKEIYEGVMSAFERAFGLLAGPAFGTFLLLDVLVFRTFVFRTLFVSHVIQPCFLVIES